MAHWAEHSQPLEVSYRRYGKPDDISFPNAGGDVFLFILPLDGDKTAERQPEELFGRLNRLVGDLDRYAVVAFLCLPTDAMQLVNRIDAARFQLWIAVKTVGAETPPTRLPRRHLALVIFSRYAAALRHVKTRIAYTYCPACGKTTKDYGGKKHTYHEYGTLMSDVWRDFTGDLAADPTPVLERLRDMFGLPPHRTLYVADLRRLTDAFPSPQTATLPDGGAAIGSGDSSPLASVLLNEDCLTAPARIPDDAVDFCFADPPYNLAKKYDRWDDARSSAAYFAWCDVWLRELHRILKPGRTPAVLNLPQWAARHYQAVADRMRFQNWIVWESLSFPVRFIMPAHYGVLCLSKGAPRPLPGLVNPPPAGLDADAPATLKENYCSRVDCITRRRRRGVEDRTSPTDVRRNIHRLKHNSRRVDHPCQLPPMFMARLYAVFTAPGELILDPFNGAGTSTLTAELMGRRFIGIELSPAYHALASSRHEALRAGRDPFGKTDAVPQVKNSPVERLPRRKRPVSKKTLQLDVRRIARLLGRLPTREDVQRHSPFPLAYFDDYFSSWGEVCAAARTTGMSERPPDAKKSPPQTPLFREM